MLNPKNFFIFKIFLFFFEKNFLFFCEGVGTHIRDPPRQLAWENEKLKPPCFLRKHFLKNYLSLHIFHMHMNQQQLNSIWASIDAQRDAVKAAKQPCFPVPYTLITVQRPVAGGKTGVIPCVELQNIYGSYEIRRCDDILKPTAGERVDLYLKRLDAELHRKDILCETIL